MQRNILATSPRVTRFKIDWGDGEDGENVPPTGSTEGESNQMASNGSSMNMKEELLEGNPFKMENSNSAPVLQSNIPPSCTSVETNGLDCSGVQPLAPQIEPMQM